MRNGRALIVCLCLVALAAAGCRRPDPSPAPRPGPGRSPEAPAASIGDLDRLAIGRTDKGPERHGFTEVYERFFHPLRDEPIRILEIGIDQGGSLLMWSDYFPKAQIFGIDIEDRSSMETERVFTFVADQSKREQLGAFLAKYPGPFDIVLDDGGHSMEQQQVTLGFLFPHVRPGGYYVVEDVHSSLPDAYPFKGFAVETDGSNTTLLMLERFVRTGRFESRYLTPEEADLLNRDVEFSNLFHRHGATPSVTCVLQRKAKR